MEERPAYGPYGGSSAAKPPPMPSPLDVRGLSQGNNGTTAPSLFYALNNARSVTNDLIDAANLARSIVETLTGQAENAELPKGPSGPSLPDEFCAEHEYQRALIRQLLGDLERIGQTIGDRA